MTNEASLLSLEINGLSDKEIIVLTEDNIEILIKEKNDYILNKIYKINDNWKITPMLLKYKIISIFPNIIILISFQIKYFY